MFGDATSGGLAYLPSSLPGCGGGGACKPCGGAIEMPNGCENCRNEVAAWGAAGCLAGGAPSCGGGGGGGTARTAGAATCGGGGGGGTNWPAEQPAANWTRTISSALKCAAKGRPFLEALIVFRFSCFVSVFSSSSCNQSLCFAPVDAGNKPSWIGPQQEARNQQVPFRLRVHISRGLFSH